MSDYRDISDVADLNEVEMAFAIGRLTATLGLLLSAARQPG